MKFIPHEYQKEIINKLLKNEKLLAIVDMGMGKTVCVLTALDELINNRFLVTKVLVVAPLRVAEVVWEEELLKWDHLKNLRLSKILGTEKQRIQGLSTLADIYCINRENLVWLEKELKGRRVFDCIVIDESTSFKNSRCKRYRALKNLVTKADRVIELTGTPAPNGLQDLWPQIYLLDRGLRLGRTLTQFRSEYLVPLVFSGHVVYKYGLQPNAKEKITKKISDIAISFSAADNLKLPERIDNQVLVSLPTQAIKFYNDLKNKYIAELGLEKNIVEATSAAAVLNKLLQVANGSVYDSDRKVIKIHDAKIEALGEIIEAHPGRPILVFYSFIHDYQKIVESFKELKPRKLDKKKDIEDWNSGKITLFLAHPASMGHGLNLQAGGNIIVWFGLSWNLELYQQANARLHRQGQTKTVVVHHILALKTADIRVFEALTRKEVNQTGLIRAIMG